MAVRAGEAMSNCEQIGVGDDDDDADDNDVPM